MKYAGVELSDIQSQKSFEVVEDVINHLPPQAISSILEDGYDRDLDSLLGTFYQSTDLALNLGKTLESERLNYIDNLATIMDERLKILSFNYFCATVLTNFNMGWRNIEVGNEIQLFPWSSYLMARGAGKCLSANELVVMYDGSLKKIQDIKVGDLVMGPDSTPRKVLQLHKGKAPMYKVHQTYAKDYCVNEGHLVCCIYDKKKSNPKKIPGGYYERVYKDIPVEEIPNHPGYLSKKIFGYRVNGWDLPEQDLPIDPYFLGLWLGDGLSSGDYIFKPDIEIRNAIEEYAKKLGGKYEYSEEKLRSKINGVGLRRKLQDLGVMNNKHIPDIYMRGSRDQRLQLLAGLLDSDGYLNLPNSKKRAKNAFTFEISMHNREMIEQIRFLALSLGFNCKSVENRTRNVKLKRKKTDESYTLENYEIWRVYISGKIWTIPTHIERKKVQPYEKVQTGVKSALTIEPIGEGEYYGFACDGDHKFLLEDGTVVHNSYQFCYAFPLWRLYSYTRPVPYMPNEIDNKNRKETAIITNTMTLAKNHVNKIIEELETNPILTEKLNPNNKSKLGETGIETETGAILHVRGKDGFIRGLHVGAAVVDDLPDESSLYSDEQREKLKEIFRGTIAPIVEPYGYFLVSGTPYSTAPNELYNVIKADRRFYLFQYPIIFPDGRPLAPDRYTFEDILMKKQELGTMVFSREYLCVPIADDSTIFPMEYLMRATVGMESIDFAESIEFYPMKLKRVVIGCDFAVSGNIGADYTVYACVGVDSMNNYHLINIHRAKGMSHNEQIDKICQWDRLYKPNVIVCESNGFQGILAALARERGLKNIETFTTTDGNKKDLHTGWPSLSAMFERGQMKVPFRAGKTKEMVDIVFSEFTSVTFRTDRGKLEAVGGHDDCVSGIFLAVNTLREGGNGKFNIEMV